MGNALTTLPLGIALKEFAHLEEEHHEDGFRILCLCPWQEAYQQRTDGGDGHEEVLVEGIAVSDALPCFAQRLVAY